MSVDSLRAYFTLQVIPFTIDVFHEVGQNKLSL